MDLVALKDEIELNPASLPYLALTAENAVANAEVINNSNGENPRIVNNEFVEAAEIRGQTTFDAFDGLVAAEQAWFEWLTSEGRIPVNDDTLQNLAGIPTANGSVWATGDRVLMNARMTSLMQRSGSRAEEIQSTLGDGYASPTQVRDASNL